MNTKVVVFLVVAAAAMPAAAQVYLGAELSPDSLLKTEAAKVYREDDDAFARVFVLENSTAAVYSVFESTAPERVVTDYLRQGIYRQELLMLFAMAEGSRTPFKALAKDRSKGVTLQALAAKNKVDLLELYRTSAALKKTFEEKAALINISTGIFASPASSVPGVGVEVSTAAAHADEKK